MKKIILLLGITISFGCFSQTKKSDVSVSKLTEIMIEKNYSASEIEELQKYPLKLKVLDYLYSKSFEVSEHQVYTAAQFEKIDITKYDLTRKADSNVLVFDEASGLSLILYSLNKVTSDRKSLSPSNATNQDPSGKIAH